MNRTKAGAAAPLVDAVAPARGADLALLALEAHGLEAPGAVIADVDAGRAVVEPFCFFCVSYQSTTHPRTEVHGRRREGGVKNGELGMRICLCTFVWVVMF